MRLHLLSDLHLEFGDFVPPDTGADVILLPGDIHLGVKGVEWAKATFKQQVLYVPGNHEFYGNHLNKLGEQLAAAAAGSNVQVLNDSAVVLEGVRFIGSTFWTNFNFHNNQPGDAYDAKTKLEDYKRIRIDANHRKIVPRDIMVKHSLARQFIEGELQRPFAGKTVVLTHHAPSALSVSDEFETDPLASAYASRLERMLSPKIDLWVHGHRHHSIEYRLNGTRVVCNPRGYPPKAKDLNADFNPALVLVI